MARISEERSVKKVFKNKHLRKETWKTVPGCRHGKLFISRPCKKRADDLLKLGRHQLRMVVAVLTGHAPVREHLRIMGLFSGEPSCMLGSELTGSHVGVRALN